MLLLLLHKFAVRISAGGWHAWVPARKANISPVQLFLLFVLLYDSRNCCESPLLHFLPLLLFATLRQDLHYVSHIIWVPSHVLLQYALLSGIRIERIPIPCSLNQVFNLILLRLCQGVLGQLLHHALRRDARVFCGCLMSAIRNSEWLLATSRGEQWIVHVVIVALIHIGPIDLLELRTKVR